jgi:hypothetical protein
VEGIQHERQQLGLAADAGYVLQFESHQDFQLKFESLDLRPQGIELLSVKQEAGKTTAICYVPEGKLDVFIKRIEAYRDKNTESGKPKNNALVASIETVQLAAIDFLWSDDQARLPAPNVQAWWEIWLRTDSAAALDELRRVVQHIGT